MEFVKYEEKNDCVYITIDAGGNIVMQVGSFNYFRIGFLKKRSQYYSSHSACATAYDNYTYAPKYMIKRSDLHPYFGMSKIYKYKTYTEAFWDIFEVDELRITPKQIIVQREDDSIKQQLLQQQTRIDELTETVRLMSLQLTQWKMAMGIQESNSDESYQSDSQSEDETELPRRKFLGLW